MGKFSKYVGKLKFSVSGTDFEIDFKVKDRIALAEAYDNRDQAARYSKLILVCHNLIKNSYPEENDEEIDSFLVRNIEQFLVEILISAGLTTKEEQEKLRNEVIKKNQDL